MTQRATSDAVPRIWIKPLGNTGNRALQYLVAERIRQLVPEAVIDNVRLMEWGMDTPSPEPPLTGNCRLGWNRFWIDVPGLADCLRRSVIGTLILDSFSYNLDHYPSCAVAKSLFGPTIGGADATGFGPRQLVCSVRGAEVLHNAHPNYIVLPPEYYKMLAERSGLDLVFFGQIGDDSYAQSLRCAFPDAQFVAGRNPEYDFDMLRRSVNIAPSISTFAWLAAWLSDADKIFLPVGGIFNPVQHPLQMYLPLDDARYEFFLLPFSQAVDIRHNEAAFAAQQRLLATTCRPIHIAELRDLCNRARLLAPRQPRVIGFDPAFYSARYPEVGARLQNGSLPSALEHYVHDGFRLDLLPLDFDAAFYVSNYPDAGVAVALGYFANPLHHYTEFGWSRGYAPRAI